MNHKQSNIKTKNYPAPSSEQRQKNKNIVPIYSWWPIHRAPKIECFTMTINHEPRSSTVDLIEKVSGMLSKVFLESVTSNELVSDPINNKINSWQHNYKFITI